MFTLPAAHATRWTLGTRVVTRGLATLCFGLIALVAVAQALLPVPALSAHVLDTTGTLTATQLAALESKLASFERDSGTQIAMLMVPTSQPEDIASYANRVGNSWRIGRKGVGDGLLVVVAKTDRKVRIEVAKALEGAIPDLAAKQIIDDAITPRFRVGDFAGGLDAAAERIIALVKGEALPAPEQPPARDAGGGRWTDLIVLLFLAVPIVGAIARRMLGRPLGSVATGLALWGFAFLLTSSLVLATLAGLVALLFTLLSGFGRSLGAPGWGGGMGGWSSGTGGGAGGFSAGGGGDFGGGGASGNW